jgi:acetyl-CoA synthetase
MHYPYQITTLEQYEAAYEASISNPKQFWGDIAQHFSWKTRPTEILNWNFEEPRVQWFADGELNITENCLDRHIAAGRGDETAIIWEPNDQASPGRTISYRQLLQEVESAARILKRMGVKQGDRVCIYLGMVPELPVAMLACARIGAIHSVVFAGFSARSIADRLLDAGIAWVITADGAYRGAKEIALKPVVDEALADCPLVKQVLVLRHTGTEVPMTDGRDEWWERNAETADSHHEAEPAAAMNAEDPLFILYTSGSTGKPKGVVHSTGGYMVYANYTFVNVFQYRPGEVFFCTADIGWVTGHSYIVYGPLSAGATVVLFEGVPTWPDPSRLWDIIARHKVNILYTAPTAVRSLMTFGTEPLEGKDLSSLRVLGSVGEPINEEAWHWMDDEIGKGNCPIVDTWWQTETGGVLISNLAGVTPAVPAHATLPLPGVQPLLVDDRGQELTGNDVSGNLCIRAPWPGIIRTTWGDHARCKQSYFATYPGLYFTGDGALRNAEGQYRITGRVDDVLNVSGHRIGTEEVEAAINEHEAVVESAIVGYPHDIKGHGIYAYVITHHAVPDEAAARVEIAATVSRIIGAIARPDKIQFVSGLPKTRCGKIMRRILRKIAEGETENLGDVSTLLDPGVVNQIVEGRLV